MLVLSRRKGERVLIGDGIEVVVSDISGDRVRLGFVAPADMAIHREEVFQRIAAEQAACGREAYVEAGALI